MPFEVVEVADPEERSQTCALVLRALPAWFGIEQATRHYIEEAAALPMLAVRAGSTPAGFVSLKQHFPQSAEIYAMGVTPECHRQGIGRALLEAAEGRLRSDGVTLLQVKTLGPSDPDAGYERTRRFYAAMGFVPVEELHTLWEANPCLLMVKQL